MTVFPLEARMYGTGVPANSTIGLVPVPVPSLFHKALMPKGLIAVKNKASVVATMFPISMGASAPSEPRSSLRISFMI